MTRRALLLLLLGASATARAQPGPPGPVILLRHASAPGVGDPPGFRLGDCTTQRVLDDAGRAQARAIGAHLRAAGVAAASVFASEWCRTSETAALLDLGPVRPMPALNSFFADGSTARAQTASVREVIAGWTGPALVLVTHQVNITALTGIVPADGEAVVVRAAAGRLVVLGRMTAQSGRGLALP